MATRKPNESQYTDPLPGEDEMARVYRAATQDVPPVSLDARILAEAQRAVAKPKAHAPFGGRWAIPLSTVAVIALSLGVVLLLTKQGALNHRSELEVPSEYTVAPAVPESADAECVVIVPAVAPPVADMMRSDERVAAPAKAKRAAQEPETRIAESVASKPAASAPVELKNKVEAPPATATPQAPGRMQDVDRLSTAREEKTLTRSTAAGVLAMKTQGAEVIAVQASGQPGSYQFNVTVKSLDTGCKQYADWWEVVSADGKLLYRRVLLHSHVDEQPFTRSGEPVPIQPDTVVWVRVHMNTGGYGGVAFKGSVKAGFKQVVPDADFATGLDKQAPLPDGCDF